MATGREAIRKVRTVNECLDIHGESMDIIWRAQLMKRKPEKQDWASAFESLQKAFELTKEEPNYIIRMSNLGRIVEAAERHPEREAFVKLARRVRRLKNKKTNA